MAVTGLTTGKKILLKSALLSMCSTVALAGGVSAAMAQETGASAADDQDVIVVSARRRDESLQDVPVAVTAVSGEKLEATGAVDITAVQRFTPNSTIEVARGTNSTLIAFIRGVGQQDPLWGFEPGVGLYVDDIYIARPQGAILDIFDVERIEVLRGPQGTLYGRNTIGGAIKYVTKDLNLEEPEFSARVNVGTYGQFDQILTGSIPLSDTFAIGGAIANYKRDGFGTNLTTGADHYDKDVIAGRLNALWVPTDTVKVRLAYDKTEDNSDAKHGHRLLPGVTNGEPVTSDIYDTRGGAGDDNSVESEGGSIIAEWNVSDAVTLKSITAMREDFTTTPIDFDALAVNDFDVPAFYDNEQFTQEILANFEYDRISGVAGLFYLDGQYDGAFDVVLGNFGVNVPTAGQVSKESIAVFADISIDLTDRVSLSLGGRYTEDDTEASVLRQTFLGTAPSPLLGGPDRAAFATSSDFTSARTDDAFTPRVAINYEPNDDLTLYASFSEGFKSGGFDPRGNAGPEFIDADGDGQADDPSVTFQVITSGFAPEFVETYEIGAKGNLLDGNLTYAATAFWSDYTDQQITVQTAEVDPITGLDTFVSTVLNAGESEYSGLELEGLWRMSDVFSLDFMMGYIDAEINQAVTVVPDTTGAPVEVDISDQFVVQNTPELTGRLGLNANFPLDDGSNLLVTASASYRGDYNIFNVDNEGPATDPLLPAGTEPLDPDSYTLFDASVVWEVNDNWSLSLIGRNLTDEEYKVAGYNFAGSAQLGVDGAYSAFYGAPQTFTASIEYNY
ncbi:TonB-dependent receptor [Parvularcula sp. IMCC14364]|uniref:TonB-dependent receptor n=1 Tax=Parvularcula sp. IMCC14364 TaxID=3067902 RepID=UPI0027412166|nr:TonB-dependent receptor [Parvularcula sp. IMCC14364]